MNKAMAPARPPKVFVAIEPRPRRGTNWVPNLGPATKYGGIEYVFDKTDVPYLNTAASIRKALARLIDFDPRYDFLLWPQHGDPASFWIIVQVLATRGYHQLRYLYWSRQQTTDGSIDSSKEGYYMPITIDTTQIGNIRD